jgi:sirohydrochlorin cobaltochelatase
MKGVLVLVGHGSRDPAADDVLPYYVEKLSAAGKYSAVRACYLEKPPSLEAVLREMDAGRIYVMPLLLAPGHHTIVTIPEAIRASGKKVVLLEPIGRSQHLVRLIEERVGEAGGRPST